MDETQPTNPLKPCEKCGGETPGASMRRVLGYLLCTPCRKSVEDFIIADLKSRVDPTHIRSMTLADVDEHARKLLAWVATLDPMWAERIEIMQAERKMEARQVIGCCIGYIMEQGLHTIAILHPAFEPGYQPPAEARCPVCRSRFRQAYPGQPVCSNECAEEFYKKPGQEPAEEQPAPQPQPSPDEEPAPDAAEAAVE